MGLAHSPDENVGISPCELWGCPGDDGQSATDKIVPDVGGEITADDLFIGVLSSFPTQTPTTISGVNPMNQASRYSWCAGLSTNRDIWNTRRLPGPLAHDPCSRSIIMARLAPSWPVNSVPAPVLV